MGSKTHHNPTQMVMPAVTAAGVLIPVAKRIKLLLKPIVGPSSRMYVVSGFGVGFEGSDDMGILYRLEGHVATQKGGAGFYLLPLRAGRQPISRWRLIQNLRTSLLFHFQTANAAIGIPTKKVRGYTALKISGTHA